MNAIHESKIKSDKTDSYYCLAEKKAGTNGLLVKTSMFLWVFWGRTKLTILFLYFNVPKAGVF